MRSLVLAVALLALSGCFPDTDVAPPESTGDELITGSDGRYTREQELRGDDDLQLVAPDGRIDRDDPY